VNVGLGAGTRERDMMMMSQIIALQEKIVANMGLDNPFVTPENFHKSVTSLTASAGIKSPDMYFSAPDPQDIERRKQIAATKPTPEQEKAQAAMQIEQMKAQLAIRSKEMDVQVQNSKEQAQLQADLQVKQAEMEKDAIARREQLEADAIKEEQKANLAREQMAQARELKLLELAQQRELAMLSSGIEEGPDGVPVQKGAQAMAQVIEAVQMLASQVQGISAMQSAPRRVVRDPMTGDIVGVEVDGGSAQRVVRDPVTNEIVSVETVQ
jgi:NADH dehydrogenase/NADH:ubiquinone oxidoreductase subunit G